MHALRSKSFCAMRFSLKSVTRIAEHCVYCVHNHCICCTRNTHTTCVVHALVLLMHAAHCTHSTLRTYLSAQCTHCKRFAHANRAFASNFRVIRVCARGASGDTARGARGDTARGAWRASLVLGAPGVPLGAPGECHCR